MTFRDYPDHKQARLTEQLCATASRHPIRLTMCYLLTLLLLIGLPAKAQQPYTPTIPKGLVILQSTRNYAAALAGAKQAATQLQRSLRLDGRKPHKVLGLSASYTECEKSGCSYPCYWPRGQDMAETSEYISIEFSTSFKGLAKGFYIVVAASGPPNSATLKQALVRVRRAYPTAYAKNTVVGLGCVY